MSKEKVIIFCDGASRGNPGNASLGVIAFNEGSDTSLKTFRQGADTSLFKLAEKIGLATNNEAEYAAIIRALEMCNERDYVNPTIFSDSELIIKQMRREYKVKNENLKELFSKAQDLAAAVAPTWVHVRREKNQIADYLANSALDGNEVRA